MAAMPGSSPSGPTLSSGVLKKASVHAAGRVASSCSSHWYWAVPGSRWPNWVVESRLMMCQPAASRL
jgi:hypothetical protein